MYFLRNHNVNTRVIGFGLRQFGPNFASIEAAHAAVGAK